MNTQKESESISLLMGQESWESQAVSPQDMMQESVSTKWNVPVFLKKVSGEYIFEKEIEFATTICARDAKGFCKQGMNGVIVWTQTK